MFLRLSTVGIVFCVIAKCILINSINRLNLIFFLMGRNVFSVRLITRKCLCAIWTKITIQNARIMNLFSSRLSLSLFALVVFQTCNQATPNQDQFQSKFGIVFFEGQRLFQRRTNILFD
jgi:hypothetical protein